MFLLLFYQTWSENMKRIVSIAAVVLAIIGIANSSERIRGSKLPSFATASLRAQYGLALAEFMFGDAARAVDRAKVTGLPRLITVKFESDSSEEHKLIARNAIARWNEELGFDLFLEVNSPANVVVSFNRRVWLGDSLVAGLNEWTRTISPEGELRIEARIDIATHRPGGDKLTDSQLEKTTLHEFGHLLGLKDEHDSNKLMGPLSLSGDSSVHSLEIENVRRFASTVDEIGTIAPASRLKKAPRIFRFKDGN